MNYTGLIIAISTFIIIGIFHPIVIKAEYHFGTRSCWVFALAGIAFIAALATGNVNNMQQQAAALHMAQEIVAQTNALAGTLDQAGDVGADKACALAHRHNAQRGHKGGKVVVGDLGLGGADPPPFSAHPEPSPE